MTQTNICIFGDSITWGPRLPFRVAWANLLRNHLEKNATELFRVYDLGVDMDTTRDLIRRMENEALARKPGIVIFNIGVNDSLYRNTPDNPESSLEEFASNIQKLIDMASRITKNVLIVGLVKGSDKWTTPLIQSTTGKIYTKARTRLYDRKLCDLASRNKILFADVNEVLHDEDFDDGLHPNANGHMKMFGVISKMLDPLLGLQKDKFVTLVNEKDEVVGKKLLDEIVETDITRVAGLWIENSRGEVLLAKRPIDKRRDPNRWGPAIAAMVKDSDNYLSAIKSAAENEIGMIGETLQESKKLRIVGPNNFYCQLYYLQSDLKIDNLKLNESEVQTLKWISKDELTKEFNNNPQFFVQSFGDYLKVFNNS